MGFKLGRIYVLEFEGTGLEGAVVKLRSPSIDLIDTLLELERDEAYAAMIEHVTEWNLEAADGTPLPLTLAALKAEAEPGVPMLILKEWYRAARGVTAPLDPRSAAGTQQPAEENTVPSIPMETQ